MPASSSNAKNRKKKNKKKNGSQANPDAGGGGGGGADSASPSASASSSQPHPVSRLDTSLTLPDGIKQHFFDPVKGKGFVATKRFEEGEVVFADEAFVAAPPMKQAKAVEQGQLCNACFQPVDGAGVGLNVGCRAKGCSSVWCNRDCEQKARTQHHNLLCRGANPAVAVSY